ncbi:MAG: UDP-N-acetylmuramoyl-L-alanine--D-glutamate ligase [Oscillospiraceae bacterium]|nr:UDP-N-acetylmuramoyl-L-alanine--D-glutamate ligase [Oscillospiraceae bacterium]
MKNELWNRYLTQLKDKNILVLGLGVSNRPLVRLLLEAGLRVTGCDRCSRENLDAEVLELERLGMTLKAGEGYLDDVSAHVVFRTPGMHPDHPALCRLRESGAIITSEMEAFFEVCPCPILAVTGSDGKTTTTTLIAEMLRQAGHTVHVGGNIGTPLLPLASQMEKTDFAVVELSSFQLMTMKRSAHVAVVTNLAPNHLDMHKDMAEYVSAKENIYLHQSSADRVILNADNEITASFAPKAVGAVEQFSRIHQPKNGCFFRNNVLYLNGEAILYRDEIRLPGMHNVENYMAAICAVYPYVSVEDIRTVARNFGGVEHRIEFVRELRGMKFYNDSIASSPSRTTAGLHAFPQKVILIAGGYDKKIPFDELGKEICDHVKALILCGATADKIRKAVESAPNFEGQLAIHTVENLTDAVKKAVACGEAGDVITLSPACAAFDQFKNFMVRGQKFKEIVMELE